MNNLDLFIEVISKINKSWTLGQYLFNIILKTSPILSITIYREDRNDSKFPILSVNVFKDIQIIGDKDNDDENEGYKNVTYNTSDGKFERLIEFIESILADLEEFEYNNVILPIIFPEAIEIGEDYLVEAIIDKCIGHYNNNYDKCYAPKILSIITASFSELHDIYPNYAKKVISTLTIYNGGNNHDLKMRNTDKEQKEHLESCSDYKDSKISKIINYKFRFNEFLYSPLELSFLFIIIILYLSLFFVYNHRDVLVSLILATLVVWLVIIMMGPAAVPLEIRRTSVELFVPLINFSTYPLKSKSKSIRSNFLKKIFLTPTSNESNEFIKNHYGKYSKISEIQSCDLYSDWNGEALINFKWDHFAKFYHYCNWFIFTIFLFVFAFSTVYPTKFLIIDIIFGLFLLFIEARKFIFHPKKYVWSEINYVNLKMILFLFPTEIFGPYLSLLRHVAKHIFSFILILLFLILAFAHAFFILLRPINSFDASQPVFDDDPNNPWNMASTYNSISSDKNVSKDPILIQLPNLNTNLYAFYNTSFVALYQLMTGNTNSLDSWDLNQNPTLVILWLSYSFVIAIYILNLFIGLLNNAIQEKYCRQYFLFQKAEIIAEIELFWLFPYQRRWKEWFPDYIWYNAYVDDLRKKIKDCYSYEGDRPIIHPKLLELVKMKDS
ncbi:hypothetical protein RclHR1_00750007 [Rhizophagus clarus]|uniref:Ion transport domain-containing protein n=1 Tax=Rhizophagus clarus TaxID=94130 RepID=A0A2Z6S3F9_9GLOM|nr:hypothetical protein RclHR1_00750007 [Rhizophagus clarus]GES85864.1 hypothetical protein GLOIN_2v1781616 [Rhizophagus clarus]